jgi:LPS O-antigen subunit length determinant protein (WzzB/FepE family)
VSYFKKHQFQEFWWVIILCVLSFSCFWYLHAQQKKELYQLDKVITKLEDQKQEELEKHEDYTLKIKSFSDPAYIEMVLIQNLGLVPKDQMKVVY